MKSAYSVVKTMINTEKGTEMRVQNRYLFRVGMSANKIDIKRAVEELYNVTVTDVNTLIMRGKKRRLRYQVGKTPDWKKAVVRLKDGDKIDVT